MQELDNRNIDIGQIFKEEAGDDAVTYNDEYDYEFYTPEYTQWLESKVEELTLIILRSNKL